MKSFHEYTDDECLDESTVRNVSAAVLFQQIHSKSREIKRANDIDKKMELIASQNTHLAAMVFAMTQFQPKK